VIVIVETMGLLDRRGDREREAGMDIIIITTTIIGRERGKERDERGVRMPMRRYLSLRAGVPRIRARTITRKGCLR
jgi:hypothetical protein